MFVCVGVGGARCRKIVAAVHRALPHSFDWMLKGMIQVIMGGGCGGCVWVVV